MKDIVVIYHGGCADGFSGAWAARKKFGSRATYIGAFDRNVPSKGLRGKEIYLIDYTYKLPVIQKLIRENKRVTAIDHHVTAREAVMRTRDHSFDLKHSGAVLAWKYFHLGRLVPQFLRYVEDFDLWRFKLPQTRELMAFLDWHEQDFKVWDKLIRGFESAKTRRAYAEKGSLVLASQSRIQRDIIETGAELVRFSGYRAYAVNSPVFISDIGHELAKRSRTLAIIWAAQRGAIRVSLRSSGKIDVAKIAERYGGGGHKNAAGFILPEGTKLPWKRIKR